jgi:alpha-beta hydrolase superfamily lysophospholipase
MAEIGEWGPDVLGDKFEQATLYPRATEQNPKPEATLVRHVGSTSTDPSRPVAVLYLHGFVDYFFHPHLAEALSDAGYAFYALDLRGYGRSMAAHVESGFDANMAESIAEYAADLDAAAENIRKRGHQKLVVLAHSMGGLVATLWQAGARGTPDKPSKRADALILNAPWFELNENALLQGPITGFIAAMATVAPRAVVGNIHPFYGQALHAASGGEWDFNLTWKPHEGFGVQASWLTSIRDGQRRIMTGQVRIKVPVLVLASTRTGPSKTWHPDVITSDSVLDVQHMALAASRLGDDVRFVQIPGGAHDLALSREPARSDYLHTVIDWLNHKMPSDIA